jgi:hypothetical protein
VQQPVAGLAPALDPVTAEHVDRLRGEPQVGHYRDAGRDQFLHLPGHPLPALQLDRVRPGFLEEPGGGGQRAGR